MAVQPQIRRTWQRKLVGSLSIPMMLIQTPGSFVFVYSMLLRPGANWTTWLVFLISACSSLPPFLPCRSQNSLLTLTVVPRRASTCSWVAPGSPARPVYSLDVQAEATRHRRLRQAARRQHRRGAAIERRDAPFAPVADALALLSLYCTNSSQSSSVGTRCSKGYDTRSYIEGMPILSRARNIE